MMMIFFDPRIGEWRPTIPGYECTPLPECFDQLGDRLSDKEIGRNMKAIERYKEYQVKSPDEQKEIREKLIERIKYVSE